MASCPSSHLVQVVSAHASRLRSSLPRIESLDCIISSFGPLKLDSQLMRYSPRPDSTISMKPERHNFLDIVSRPPEPGVKYYHWCEGSCWSNWTVLGSGITVMLHTAESLNLYTALGLARSFIRTSSSDAFLSNRDQQISDKTNYVSREGLSCRALGQLWSLNWTSNADNRITCKFPRTRAWEALWTFFLFVGLSFYQK